jgi:predicted nucleotidyltransferase
MSVIYLQNSERKKVLTAALEQIIDTLEKDPDVKKIILFGSLAEGKIGIKSDLDLLVIKDTDKPFLTRLREIMQQLNPCVAVDILVYTPEEFREMQSEPNSFIRDVLQKGRVVYAKKHR